MGTTTVRLAEQVVREVPPQVPLEALSVVPTWVRRFRAPTVTIVLDEGGVRLEVDQNVQGPNRDREMEAVSVSC